MNENIINTLEQYVKDINPQYAILLSGSWGCGKTYFIDAWIKNYIKQQSQNKKKHSKNSKPTIDLKPIKVSLFGLQTKLEFIDTLNKELSPFLFNLKKCGLTVAKVVSRVALKSDIINDFQSPVEVEFSALDTLLQGNENVSIKGEKLIILDDVERCRIPTVELFGLIDLLLHKYQCKIIIIGDEAHLKKAGETEYTQYKEKIIGQTLAVQNNSSAAFDAFVLEIESITKKAAGFIKKNKECVLDTFNASKYSNLRSLKQALHQFAFLYKKLGIGAEDYKREILANYVAISMELHNDPSVDLSTLTQSVQICFKSKKDENVNLQSKYQFIEGKHHVHLFSGFYRVYLALMDGHEIASDINTEIRRINSKPLYNTYKNYYKMSNSDFVTNTKKVHGYLEAPVNSLYDYIVLLYYYCKVQHEGLISIDEFFFNDCINKCIDVLNSITNLNNFVPYESSVSQAFSAVSYETKNPLFDKVKNCLWDVINNQKIKLKDNLTNILEDLSDDKIESFKEIINGTDPYNHANYNLQSIFDKINADDFVKGFLSLSNENKEIVCLFIGHRYERLQNVDDILRDLSPDKDNLQLICHKLQEAEEQLELIDKLQVNKFITMLEDAVAKLNLVAENLIEQIP